MALCITRILYQNIDEGGIYLIIVFLDTSMNFGQGIMTCAVFGLESKYVFLPIVEWLKRVKEMYENIKKREHNGCAEEESYSLKLLHHILRTFVGRSKIEY